MSIVALTAFISSSGVYPTVGESLRHVTFNVIAVATTCGFRSVDYSTWPLFAPMWMLLLSCLIPSTGSTGGGIKMFRALVLIKQSFREMFILVHPQAVAPLKIAGSVIPNRAVYSVLAFIFVYFMTIVVLTLAMLLSNLDFITAFTADPRLHQQRRSRPRPRGSCAQLRRADGFPDLGLHRRNVPGAHRAVHRAGAVHARLLAKVAGSGPYAASPLGPRASLVCMVMPSRTAQGIVARTDRREYQRAQV